MLSLPTDVRTGSYLVAFKWMLFSFCFKKKLDKESLPMLVASCWDLDRGQKGLQPKPESSSGHKGSVAPLVCPNLSNGAD